MKALFIGGTGTISASVTELALKRGWDITLLNMRLNVKQRQQAGAGRDGFHCCGYT